MTTRIPHDDQKDLEFYFGPGAAALESSPLGYMLDKAELMTFGSQTCPGCHGEGFPPDHLQRIEAEIKSVRKWQADNAEKIRSGKVAALPPGHDDGLCRICHGQGVIPQTKRFGSVRRVQLTARPTGSSKGSKQGQETPTGILERFGEVSHRMYRLGAETMLTLELYFGNVGSRWSETPKRGRIWALLPRTNAGRKLVRLSRALTEGESNIRDDEVLDNDATLELTQPGTMLKETREDGTIKQHSRKKLLADAQQQAQDALRRAEDAWMGSPATRKVKTLETFVQGLQGDLRELGLMGVGA